MRLALVLAAVASGLGTTETALRTEAESALRTEEETTPRYHFYPSSAASQDISAPIGIVDADGAITWHIFVDCGLEGRKINLALAWCHFSSTDLVAWTEHAVAVEPDEPFDDAIIDTGAIFQHPNGSVWMVYATANTTSMLKNGTFDGNVCFAEADDLSLETWTKRCDESNMRIDNPTCHYCRETCPDSCPGGAASAYSPFPASSTIRTKIAAHAGVALLYTNDYDMAGEWTLVRDVTPADVFFYSQTNAPMYSCPDVFRAYLQGTTTHESLSIWKTGGVGPNNALDAGSRRLYFGTVGWPNVHLPQLNASIDYLHTGSVVSLPRDVFAAPDGGPRFAFPPELVALRASGAATGSASALASGLFLELRVDFAPTGCGAGTPFGVELFGSGAAPKMRDPGAGSLLVTDDETLQIYFDPKRCELNGRKIALADGAALSLHIYVDLGLVEFTANNLTNGFGYRKVVNSSTAAHAAFGDVAVAAATSWELKRVNGGR
ncbi:glycosyl hydrolase [Aureococcus anophagefferens]|nr:glycosyl hydrolase [Aureococcus anophagefferens]